MIIGIDTSAIGNRVTGTSRYIECLLKELQNTNHTIKTFSPDKTRSKNKLSLLNSIPIIKRGRIRRHFFRTFELNKKMMNDEVNCGFFPNYLMPLNFKKPAAIIIHDLSFISHPHFYSKAFVWYYKDQLKKVLKSNPFVCAVSETTRKSIIQYLNVDKKNIFLLQAYREIDRNESIRLLQNAKSETPYFLYVGHIEPRKNLYFMIENFLRWKKKRHSEYRLKLVGEIWSSSLEIQSIMKLFSKEPDIEFCGYVPDNELNMLYANASAFVHTSLVEGFGFPVLEAMNYGLPVLCSEGTGTAEISAPYSIQINPTDKFSLMNGFDKLAANAGTGKEVYSIKYSPQLMCEQLDQLLDAMKIKKQEKDLATLSEIEIQTAIEKTLLYSKLFNSGVKMKELHSFLLEKVVSKEQLEISLISLRDKNLIAIKDDMVFLNKEINNIYQRKNKTIDINLINKLLKVLQKVPLISAIAFSGGTANYGLENHEDIDLFIITKPYTVYIVYFIIHMISLLFNSRNIICTNYLIDEKEIEIKINRDLFTAHQIITLVPFKNKSFMNYFLNRNEWIKSHYPNFVIPDTSRHKMMDIFIFLKPINIFFKYLYSHRYRKYLNFSKLGEIILAEHVIKLHTHDYRIKILNEFQSQWDKYMSEKNNVSVILS